MIFLKISFLLKIQINWIKFNAHLNNNDYAAEIKNRAKFRLITKGEIFYTKGTKKTKDTKRGILNTKGTKRTKNTKRGIFGAWRKF
jgi:hypothetical protein